MATKKTAADYDDATDHTDERTFATGYVTVCKSVSSGLCVVGGGFIRITRMKTKFAPGDGPFHFKVKLEGMEGMNVAALRPPFDVPTIFGTKARVPVRGTINGHPFRSSLCNMGAGHFMVVNKDMRAGANCKAGDVVDVMMERDREKRVVEVPSYIAKIISSNSTAEKTWESLSFTHQKEWVRAIQEAKRPETRDSRIKKMMEALKAGKRVGA